MAPPKQQSANAIYSIPYEYQDLSPIDIKLLNVILSRVPEPNTTAYRDWANNRQTLISQLPRHLLIQQDRRHGQHTGPSSNFCSLHRRLNPRPLMKLYAAMRLEIDNELFATWIPLRDRGLLKKLETDLIARVEDLHGIWLSKAAFQVRFGRKSKTASATTPSNAHCAACCLAQLAASLDPLLALAACMLGRMSRSTWHTSTRVVWLVESVKNCVPERKQKSALEFLWTMADHMLRARTEAKIAVRGDMVARWRQRQEQQEEQVRKLILKDSRGTGRDGAVATDGKLRRFPPPPAPTPCVSKKPLGLGIFGLSEGQPNQPFGREQAEYRAGSSSRSGQPNHPFDREPAKHRARSIFRSGQPGHPFDREPAKHRARSIFRK